MVSFLLTLYGKERTMNGWKLLKGYNMSILEVVNCTIGEICLITRKEHSYAQLFRDIRTVDNVVYPSFRDACYTKGLLDDKKEYIDGIIEASNWGIGHYLQRLFVILLVSNQLAQPYLILNKTWEYLTDELLHRQRGNLQILGNSISLY